mmetsp:Transcript_29424/g.62507  ORF Transcript_29424/g.62507 Transcript_29424/m.62507 type:complete len:381 (-) Transcript_29424:321-1463(-)
MRQKIKSLILTPDVSESKASANSRWEAKRRQGLRIKSTECLRSPCGPDHGECSCVCSRPTSTACHSEQRRTGGGLDVPWRHLRLGDRTHDASDCRGGDAMVALALQIGGRAFVDSSSTPTGRNTLNESAAASRLRLEKNHNTLSQNGCNGSVAQGKCRRRGGVPNVPRRGRIDSLEEVKPERGDGDEIDGEGEVDSTQGDGEEEDIKVESKKEDDYKEGVRQELGDSDEEEVALEWGDGNEEEVELEQGYGNCVEVESKVKSNQDNDDEEEVEPERGNDNAIEVEGEVDSKEGDDVEPEQSARNRRSSQSGTTATRRGPRWSKVTGTRRGSHRNRAIETTRGSIGSRTTARRRWSRARSSHGRATAMRRRPSWSGAGQLS